MPPLRKEKAISEFKDSLVKDTPPEVESLEESIKTCINDMSKEDIEGIEGIEKEYEEFKQMSRDQASNNEIIHQILTNRSKTQDIESRLESLKSKESDHFVEMMKELHYIKKFFNKGVFIMTSSVAITFYLLGTQHDQVFPFINGLMNLFNMTGGE